ncbi:MAG: response regulator [Thermoanaerobaculia bacterium]
MTTLESIKSAIAGPGAAGSLGVLRLLLVEDSAGDARLLREMVAENSALGVDVSHVESMAEAERQLALATFDVMVLDLDLPDAEGLEAVRRAHQIAPRVPVVVLTGRDDDSLAVQALHAGAEDYLVKDQIERRALQRALRHAVERRALREALLQEKAGAKVAARLFRTLIENLPDVIARFDTDLRHLYVSPTIQSLTGRPPEEHLGKTNRELGMPPELLERWETALLRVFASGRPEQLEFAYPAQSGIVQFDCRLVPEFGGDNEHGKGRGNGSGPLSVLTVARDVTERWAALEAERLARGVAEELREATIELTRSLDREVVLVTLLERLRQLVPFDHASVMLLEETSRLSLRAVFDNGRVLPVPVDAQPKIDAADHPVVQSILATGAAVLIPDLRAHPAGSVPTGQRSAGSWMGVPLFARGNVAGLVSLSTVEADAFTAEQVRLAEAMSSQASVAVENAVLFAQMQASTKRLQALSRRLVEAQEDERRSIARELHDEAGQSLTSLRIGLRLLEREIAQGAVVGDRVAELVRTTDAVIDGLHRLAADLRPASLDHLGLDAAVRQYAREATVKYGLAVHFKARGFSSERLPAAVETALYRVVQEAMTNVVRHARATRVDILAEHRGDRVMVMIEDDGAGFDPQQVHRTDHFGLLGMRERADALGGSLTLESAPGAGTTIVVEVSSADPHSDR